MSEENLKITLDGHRRIACIITEESITVYKRKKLEEEIPWYQIQWKVYMGGKSDVGNSLTFWRENTPQFRYSIDSSITVAHTFSLLCPNPRTNSDDGSDATVRTNRYIREAKPENTSHLYSEAELKLAHKRAVITEAGFYLSALLTVFFLLFPVSENAVMNVGFDIGSFVVFFVFVVLNSRFSEAPIRDFNARIALKREREAATHREE